MGAWGTPVVPAPGRGAAEMRRFAGQGLDGGRKTEQQNLEQKRVPLPPAYCSLGSALFFPLLPSQHLQPHFSECRQKSLPSSCLQDGSAPVPLPQHPPLSQPICPHATSSHSPPGKASRSAFPPSLLQGTLAAELCVPSTLVLPLPAAGSQSHPSHNQATAIRSVHSLPSIAWSERKTHSISILSPLLLPLFLPLPEATCEQMQTPRKGSDLLK